MSSSWVTLTPTADVGNPSCPFTTPTPLATHCSKSFWIPLVYHFSPHLFSTWYFLSLPPVLLQSWICSLEILLSPPPPSPQYHTWAVTTSLFRYPSQNQSYHIKTHQKNSFFFKNYLRTSFCKLTNTVTHLPSGITKDHRPAKSSKPRFG